MEGTENYVSLNLTETQIAVANKMGIENFKTKLHISTAMCNSWEELYAYLLQAAKIANHNKIKDAKAAENALEQG